MYIFAFRKFGTIFKAVAIHGVSAAMHALFAMPVSNTQNGMNKARCCVIINNPIKEGHVMCKEIVI